MSAVERPLPRILGRKRLSRAFEAQHRAVPDLARYEDQLLAERVATFLRRMYPEHTAKRVARDTDVPWKTVKNWLQLRASPKAAHFLILVNTYGLPFLDAVDPDGLPFLKDVRTAMERRDLLKRFEEVMATANKMRGDT